MANSTSLRSQVLQNGSDAEPFDNGITSEDKQLLEILLRDVSDLPKHAWRVPLSHNCKEPCRPFTIPRPNQLVKLAPTGLRVLRFWLRKRIVERKKPFIDVAAPLPHRPIYGVPLGGIGSGTIGRGYRGEFCRFQLMPADYVHSVVETNHFLVTVRRCGRVIYNNVLSVKKRAPKYAGMQKWHFAFPEQDAAYVALYPRSWTVYRIEQIKLRLICRQVSPVIPENYTDSCLPVAVFVWTVESYDDAPSEPLDVSITFTFKNGVGHKKLDRAGTVRNHSFSYSLSPSARLGDESTLAASSSHAETSSASPKKKPQEAQQRLEGTLIGQTIDGQPCTYVLGARAIDGCVGDYNDSKTSHYVDVSTCVAFDPKSKAQRSATRCGCVSHERAAAPNRKLQLGPGESEDGVLTSADSIVSHSTGSTSQVSVSRCNPLSATKCKPKRADADVDVVRNTSDESGPSYAQLDSESGDTLPELSCTELNSGIQFWDFLNTFGRLLAVGRTDTNTKEGCMGISSEFVETFKRDVCAAVCATCTIKPRERATLEFVLGWHMPEVNFKGRERRYKRRYTRWFSNDLGGAVQLAAYAMQHYHEWEAEIEDWQAPVLQNESLPEWYKYALFNETYFISDGGTVWLELHEDEREKGIKFGSELQASESYVEHARKYMSDVQREIGHFAYLEGHEYRMFNTYDVHFYASFALVMLWPKLQKALQLSMAHHALAGDDQQVTYVFTGQRRSRLERLTVPHDVGNPEDEPFVRVNAYEMAPSADWKDLAPKFVLQTYRDAMLTDDMVYLRTLYPVTRTVFKSNLRLDSNEDGLPDHTDVPDSTFDAWLLRGACVYTSVLWLCALYALSRMAEKLLAQSSNEDESRLLRLDMEEYSKLFEKVREAVESNFWNEAGGYYQFASNRGRSARRRREVVMAASLMGFWYLQSCASIDKSVSLDDVLPHDHVKRCLEKIYEANVRAIRGGCLGAVNGAHADGTPDISSMQSEEVWTGVVYALSSSMIQAGLQNEGMLTAQGCFTACLRRGVHFQTPEAFCLNNRFRSLGYMRPLSIWSMQLALDQKTRKATVSDSSQA